VTRDQPGRRPLLVRRTGLALATLWLGAIVTHATVNAQGARTVTPAPTGPMPVGSTEWRLVDESRRETWVGSDAPREIKIVAWYPASRPENGARPAPYLREGAAEVRAFATRLGVPDMTDRLAASHGHAALDAAPAASPTKFPVLLFSPGYTAWPSAYTALLEDLSSHGYVVLSINHPYETTAATLSNGRVASFLDDSLALLPSARRVFDEWKTEDSMMAAVTRATDEEEQRRLLREYLGGLKETLATLQRWVEDTRLVLDRLAALDKNTVAARLATRLDLGAIGAFGHSMGGVTSAQFCLDDRRCRGVLNLDGSPQYGTLIAGWLGRPILMVYSARAGRLGASDAIYRRAAKPYYRLEVDRTLHADFTDVGFWSPVIREKGVIGALEPERTTQITRAIVREYFDQVLRGRTSALLRGDPVFAEVKARVF
jgi:dienelactone hydrolase